MAREEMRTVTTEGVEMVVPLSDHEASLIGRHANAVKAFINTGDVDALVPFRGLTVGGRRLETDPDELESLARDSELDYEDIYEEPS
jgi:hypothetical protein